MRKEVSLSKGRIRQFLDYWNRGNKGKTVQSGRGLFFSFKGLLIVLVSLAALVSFVYASAGAGALQGGQGSSGGLDRGNAVLLMHLDEASGAIVDCSRERNDGVYNGVLYEQKGKVNTAIGFDGINDYVLSDDRDSLDLSNTFTVNLWFSPFEPYSASADYVQGLIDKGSYRIYLDKSDGKLKANLSSGSNNWRLSFDGNQQYILSLAVYDGKLYAGQGASSGSSGDILVFDGNSWELSFDGDQEYMLSLAVYNGKLYAGQGYTATGDGDVLVFDGSNWSVSFAGTQDRIQSLAVFDGKLYAGQGGGTGDGDVLVFDGSAWSVSYDGSQELIHSLAVYDGKLYAGQGISQGDGDVLVFDGSSWGISLDGVKDRIQSLAVYDGKLYAGQDGGTGDGDIFVFDGSTWEMSLDGTQERILSMAVYNGRLYAGQGSSTGDGDVLFFDGNSWGISLDGAQERIQSLGVFNGRLYAGMGVGYGDGDVWVLDSGKQLQSALSNWGGYHLVSLSKNSKTISLYVDGLLQDSIPSFGSIERNSLPLLIGKTYGTEGTGLGEGIFFGSMDEISIWNKGASGAEITDLFQYHSINGEIASAGSTPRGC